MRNCILQVIEGEQRGSLEIMVRLGSVLVEDMVVQAVEKKLRVLCVGDSTVQILLAEVSNRQRTIAAPVNLPYLDDPLAFDVYGSANEVPSLF